MKKYKVIRSYITHWYFDSI